MVWINDSFKLASKDGIHANCGVCERELSPYSIWAMVRAPSGEHFVAWCEHCTVRILFAAERQFSRELDRLET
jgi:hypothetical protein